MTQTEYQPKRSRGRWLHYAIAGILTLGALSPSLRANVQALSDCQDVEFIFARGSGERIGDVSHRAWQDAISAALADSSLEYSFYELGSGPQSGYQYPAAAVSGSFGDYVNLVGAFVSGGSAFEFGRSVKQGIGELESYIRNTSALCPSTKFVLGGYSQGAMVLSKALPELTASKIIYVATFGDPKLYLPEGASKAIGLIPKIPDACLGKNLSPYRVDVVDCRAYEGVLGSQRPYQPTNYLGKIGVWCNGNDIMCSSGLSIDDHTSYVSSNYYVDAAREIYAKLKAVFSSKFSVKSPTDKQLREVVFVIDETGSMRSSINSYSAEAKRLAAGILNEGGHVALFTYGDLNDRPARQICDFSCTFEDFSNGLAKLHPTGGGDEQESTLSAALLAMNSLSWTNGATKSMVILSDAGHLSPDRDGTTEAEVIKRSFEIDPVNIYTITPSAQTANYEGITSATGGKAFNISSGADLTDTILSRPTARLALSEYLGAVGDEFTFDASRSTGSGTLRFDWDLDGDGVFEIDDASSVVTRAYDLAQDHYIQVKVTDLRGYTSTMSAHLSVQADAFDRRVSITNLKSSPISTTSTEISFDTDATKVLLSVDDAVFGFLDLRSGTNQFTLGELESEATVTLTPYSAANRRGISASIIVSPKSTEPTESPDSPLEPATNPPLTALKVPNTGNFSRYYDR